MMLQISTSTPTIAISDDSVFLYLIKVVDSSVTPLNATSTVGTQFNQLAITTHRRNPQFHSRVTAATTTTAATTGSADMTNRTTDAKLEPIVTMMKESDDSDLEVSAKNRHAQERMIPGSTDERSGAVMKRGTAASTRKAGGSGDSEAGVNPARQRVRRRRQQSKVAQGIKYAALVLLVTQMVGLVLLLRYSRTGGHQHDGDPESHHHLYLASTAVFMMETMKLAICLAMLAFQSRADFFNQLSLHTVQSPQEVLKLCVPSFLYTVQNNLLYFALTNLDAATYQVCYQVKILTTALFSAVMLGVSAVHTLCSYICMHHAR
mmetsp:Transcript_5029/g.14675  ORF Transcript_5029/g.14675 Transcript_5029/m.14675 type:complete len:320 (-) Transcript_5029:77-1036(-)